MTNNGLRGEKLLWIFCLALLLISYPILTIFNVRVMVWGIPLLYMYIFLAWLLIIVFIFMVIGRRRRSDEEATPDSKNRLP